MKNSTNFFFINSQIKKRQPEVLTGRRGAQLHRKGLRDGQIDSIREWRDDQPPVQAHVLVAVIKFPYSFRVVIEVVVPVFRYTQQGGHHGSRKKEAKEEENVIITDLYGRMDG